MVKKIILASPRGFCAGVERAITVVEKALEMHGAPIYVRHHIVHNEHVITMLESKGAVFVESLEEIPDSGVVILSAHGSPPHVHEEIRRRGMKCIDATCPLVTKVHVEARRYLEQGYTLILVGHKGHQEVKGTMGQAPMALVETVDDVMRLDIGQPEKLAFLTQTTLSVDDTAEVSEALREKYPHIEHPPMGDICYATQNRQNAVKELVQHVQLILVVGSATSSNSKRLVDTARSRGVDAYLVSDVSVVRPEWLDGIERVGITSGASVPDRLVNEVVAHLTESFPGAVTESLNVIAENMRFPLPRELQ